MGADVASRSDRRADADHRFVATVMSDRPVLTIREFSAATGLSAVTIRRRLGRGLIPFTQLGGRKHRILIPIAALHALLNPAADAPSEPAARHSGHTPDAPPHGPKPRWMRGPKSS